MLALYHIVSLLKLKALYVLNAMNNRMPNPIIMVLGPIIYPLMRVFLNGQLAQDFKQISLRTLK